MFIDGDHSYQAVFNDFYMYKDLVEVGGYIVFDDYWLTVWPQTKIGINKFIAEFKGKITVIYDAQATFGQIIIRRDL